MDNMKIQMHKARGTAVFALITTVMLAAVGAETDNIWFRIAAFVFMGLFANITIAYTIAASVYASTQVTAQVITDVKAGR